MLLMKESVLIFEEKLTQPWFTYFQITGKYFKHMSRLNIIFDDFSV